MCGICGTTDVRDVGQLVAMNAAMRHRGPDDEGTYVDEQSGVGLGATRLSIIDVEGGHQPLSNESQSVWGVLNGEIYNFRQLRDGLRKSGHRFSTRSDTEVLVHLYEEYGSELAHALEGMFAFAIWDSERRLLLLGRDRYGEKPLFYTESTGVLTFASELTALLEGARIQPELDLAAIDDYFTYGYIAGAQTVVSEVSQLLPGHVLTWAGRSRPTAMTRYWSPPWMSNGQPMSPPDAIAETRHLLEASVRSRLVADVPVGVFLSGGVDSTLVAGLAAQNTSRLRTYTVGYEYTVEDETEAARRSADLIGAEHHELVLTDREIADRVPEMLAELDQPLADEALVPLRAIAEHARRQVKVAVGGEGADELFGGYPRYRWLHRAARLPEWVPRRAPVHAARLLARVPKLRRTARLEEVLSRSKLFDRHLLWVTNGRFAKRGAVYGARLRPQIGRTYLPLPWDPLADIGDHAPADFMRLDQAHWLTGDVLAKADRASMHASLELRTPYLSRELAEFAASVPAQFHVQGRGKHLLREVLRAVLPDAHSRRPKAAFRAPSQRWLRGPLFPLLEEQLRSSRLFEECWFDRSAVAELARAHREGRQDNSSVLWPIFVLGLWLDRFAQRHL